MTDIERTYWDAGLLPGGVDEAGRGALFGPVIAACVVLPPAPLIPGVADSKTLTPRKRRALYEAILGAALRVGVGEASVEEIAAMNIRGAARLAMKRAVERSGAGCVIVDYERALDIEVPQQGFVKGDARSYLIAAASIVAKVHRDTIITRMNGRYPGYGLGSHKGYGAEAHGRALRALGATEQHRALFLRRVLCGGDEHEEAARPSAQEQRALYC